MADYNLVRLEALDSVSSVEADDLILVNKKNIDGTYTSMSISGTKSFTASNIHLDGHVRNSFMTLRDATCLPIVIDPINITNQADADRVIVELFALYGEKICDLQENGTGVPGPTGPEGPAGPAGKDGNDGVDGQQGPRGVPGPRGEHGLSSYEIWLMQGNSGNEQDYLNSLKGESGDDGDHGLSAYEIWVLEDPNNNTLSEKEWIESLNGTPGTDGAQGLPGTPGAPGAPGDSAYDIYLADYIANNGDDTGALSEPDWLDSLNGTPGTDGTNGVDGVKGDDGDSAYEVWKEIPGNELGDEQDFIDDITGPEGTPGLQGDPGEKGDPGESAYEAWKDTTGNSGATKDEFIDDIRGEDGTSVKLLGAFDTLSDLQAGVSNPDPGDMYVVKYAADGITEINMAYVWDEDSSSWVDVGSIQGPQGNQGPTGPAGPDGKSAYEVYLDEYIADNGDATGALTETQWLDSLKGVEGTPGLQGDPGEKGDPGDSAYDIYLEDYITNNGDATGALPKPEWLDSLNGAPGTPGLQGDPGEKGDDGDDGDSAYETWKTLPGNDTGTEQDFIDDITGPEGQQGQEGPRGPRGKSAWASYLETTTDSPPLGEGDWVDSLKGEDGDAGLTGASAYEIYVHEYIESGQNPDDVLSQPDWIDSLEGSDGESAYEVYLRDYTDNNAGDPSGALGEPEWLDSLKGEKGEDGKDGLDGNAGFPEEPKDQQVYGRSFDGTDGAWVKAVDATGDTMSGTLYVPDMFIASQRLDVDMGNTLIGDIGPIHKPDTSTDFPDGTANFDLQQKMGLAIGQNGTFFTIKDVLYRVDYNVYKHVGNYDNLNTGSVWSLLDPALFPRVGYKSQLPVIGIDKDNDKVYIAMEGVGTSTSENVGVEGTLFEGVYSTLETTGWSVTSSNNDGFGVIAGCWDANKKRFIYFGRKKDPITNDNIFTVRFISIDGTIKDVDIGGFFGTSNDLGTGQDPQNLNTTYGTGIYVYNGSIWFSTMSEIFQSDDDFQTATAHNTKAICWEKYPYDMNTIQNYAIYQGKHFITNEYGGLFSISDLTDPKSVVKHGVLPMADGQTRLSNKAKLFNVGNYLLFQDEKHPLTFFDGNSFITSSETVGYQTMSLAKNSEDQILFNPASDQNKLYSSNFPAAALPPDSGEDPFDYVPGAGQAKPILKFNNERVALYREIGGSSDDDLLLLKDEVDLNTQNIEAALSRLDAAEGLINDNSSQIVINEEDISNLSGRVDTIENNIADLNTSVINHTDQISDIRGDISTINGNLTTINNEISDIGDDIESIKTDIDTMITMITLNGTAIGKKVEKTGDTMTGTLTLNRTGDGKKSLRILGIRPTGNYSAEPVADHDLIFWSYHSSDGTSADAIKYQGAIDSDQHIVNKGYVDEKRNELRDDVIDIDQRVSANEQSIEELESDVESLESDVADLDSNKVNKSGDTMNGTLTISGASSDQGNTVLRFTKSNNCDVKYLDDWIVSFQGNATPTIKVACNVHLNDKKITNLAEPTSGNHAANKKYVDTPYTYRWIYQDYTSTPASTKFSGSLSSSQDMYFHLTPQQGVQFDNVSVGSISFDYQNGPMCTIWKLNSNGRPTFIQSRSISSFSISNGYLVLTGGSRGGSNINNPSLTPGETYGVTLAGFF